MKNITAKFVSGLLLALTIFSLSAVAAFNPQISDEAKNSRSRWKTGTINFAFSSSLAKPSPNIKFESDVAGAVRRSLATWEKAANIKFNEVSSEKQSVSPAGAAGDGVSLITVAPTAENLLLFGGEASEIPAKTRVFYNRKGIITEADIVLNPYVQFSTDGSFGSFDLEAVVTHEIGHLLGLEHSPLIGSTMQVNQGKNGIYNLAQTTSRTLSGSDVSNIRALYGVKDGENCCGALKGKITLSPTLAANNFYVWLEDAQTGKIQAETLTQPDGTFSLEGLSAGRYRVLAQDSGEKQKNRKKTFSGGELGEVTIDNGKVAVLEKQIAFKERSFNLKYIGSSGQISNIPISVSGGKSFQIYLGGENLNPNELNISASTPFIKVTPNTTVRQDFGDEISVLSFIITVKSNAPAGEYSLRIQKNNGEVEYFVGGIINDSVINP